MDKIKELENKLIKTKDKKKTEILLELAGIYSKKSDFKKALNYFIQANILSEKLGNKEQIVDSLIKIGNTYRHLSNYEKALDADLKSMKNLDVTKNKEKYS